MASLTLSVSEGILPRMRKHSEVKWSEVVRSVITGQWEEAEKIASESKLTEKDVAELSAAVDRDMAKHFKVG